MSDPNTCERQRVTTAEVPKRSEGHADVAVRSGRPLSGTVELCGAEPGAAPAIRKTYPDVSDDLPAALRELVDFYGLGAVESELEKLVDAAKERSVAADDNGRAWPQAGNE